MGWRGNRSLSTAFGDWQGMHYQVCRGPLVPRYYAEIRHLGPFVDHSMSTFVVSPGSAPLNLKRLFGLGSPSIQDTECYALISHAEAQP